MSERFAPPGAHVEDPVPAREPLPGRVLLAVRLLWASLALGIPSMLYELGRSPTLAVSAVSLGVQLLLVALAAYVNVCIYRGSNWARIVALVLTLLELLVLFGMANPPDVAVIEIVCSWVAAALDVVAMVLVFTPPGSAWFRKRAG